jgi:hypothetical protein
MVIEVLATKFLGQSKGVLSPQGLQQSKRV